MININMRCIEMDAINDLKNDLDKININMRCIEMIGISGFIALLYD